MGQFPYFSDAHVIALDLFSRAGTFPYVHTKGYHETDDGDDDLRPSRAFHPADDRDIEAGRAIELNTQAIQKIADQFMMAVLDGKLPRQAKLSELDAGLMDFTWRIAPMYGDLIVDHAAPALREGNEVAAQFPSLSRAFTAVEVTPEMVKEAAKGALSYLKNGLPPDLKMPVKERLKKLMPYTAARYAESPEAAWERGRGALEVVLRCP